MKKLIAKLKAWFIKSWTIITNYLVILGAYSIVYGHEEVVWAEVLLAIWMLVSAGYGGYKLFMKK